jgi:hypothetical protein
MQTLDPAAWTRWRHKELSDRFGPAPYELVRHIGRVNEAAAHAAVPAAAEASDDFLIDVRAAMAELPESVRNPLEVRLLGVYFARGLGCSAVTDVVVHDAEVVGCVVVLDIDVLAGRKANAWATWKENKPFSASGSAKLSVVIEVPGQDVRRNALQFILLHELGHVLGTAGQFLPDWWIDPRELKQACDYAFLDFSWQIDAGKQIIPSESCSFSMRDSLVFYGSALLCEGDMVEAYEALRTTSFATLYGAGNPYDDFAECFALYVHTVLMGKPYEVEISGDKTVVLCDSLSVVARCAEKYTFLEDLLHTTGTPSP